MLRTDTQAAAGGHGHYTHTVQYNQSSLIFYEVILYIFSYRMAGNCGRKIFWWIAKNMSFGRINFGG